jgi:hypothetical protein
MVALPADDGLIDACEIGRCWNLGEKQARRVLLSAGINPELRRGRGGSNHSRESILNSGKILEARKAVLLKRLPAQLARQLRIAEADELTSAEKALAAQAFLNDKGTAISTAKAEVLNAFEVFRVKHALQPV